METLLLALLPQIPSLTEEGIAFFHYLVDSFHGGRADATAEEIATAKAHEQAAIARQSADDAIVEDIDEQARGGTQAQ